MKPSPVPFLDLLPSNRLVEKPFHAALGRLYRESAFSGGPYAEAFEKDFAAYLGAPHCVGVNSGTSAIHLALLALGIGPGDEVIVPAFTFVGSAWGILYCGARPVFADVDPSTGCLDPESVARAVTPRTRAVIAVHLYGRAADLTRLREVCRGRRIALVEDAAQAHGAWVDAGAARAGRRTGAAADGARKPGRIRAGTAGEIGCFSFYPSKNLGAAGEAGAAVTADPALAERMRRLRNHGQKVRYRHDTLGFNYRMDGIQGLLLGLKLARLDEMNARRQAIAAGYLGLLRNPGAAPLGGAGAASALDSVWHLFVVRTQRRSAFQKHLEARGIGTGIHYPHILPGLPPFRPFAKDMRRYPHALALSRSVVSLPMFYGMTDAQVERVAGAVNAFRP